MKCFDQTYFNDIKYRVFIPPLILRPYITRYIIYQHPHIATRNVCLRALPNGKVELFIHLKESYIGFREKGKYFQSSHFAAGIYELNYPMKIEILCSGRIFKGLSVTFTHMGVNKFFNRPLYEFTNQIHEVELLWGDKGMSAIKKVTLAKHDMVRIKVLNQFFLEYIDQKNHIEQRDIYPILNWLEHTTGRITVDELAQNLSISYKSIYRKFMYHIGLTPKTYLKIIRFNKACKLLNQLPKLSWSELAYFCGYYDQAHFINEFHAIMKSSPKKFLRETGGNFYLNRPFSFK